MNYQDLRNVLQITGGAVSVDVGRLGAEVDALLRDTFLGASIVIREATPGPGDGANNTVVITGRAAFLGTQYPLGLPVVATFSLDQTGVHALIQYTLTGIQFGAGTWKFSQTIPDLPGVFNYARIQPDGSTTSPLDDLAFRDAAFFVASRICKEPGYGVDLATGINFAARLRPSDVMGLFQQILFGESDTLTISGPVLFPNPNVHPLPRRPLNVDRYPWDPEVVTPLQGVSLRAPLDAKPLKLGDKLTFQPTEFRIYSPPSYAWLSQNQTYRPVSAFLGKITIPSAQITVDILVETQSGATEATLLGNFKGVTVGKLAHLLDFAGTGSLIDNMPDPIKKAGDALGKLELESAKVEIATKGTGLTVLGTSATIGMPDQVWRLWPGTDDFDVSAIYARFDVAHPFDQPAAAVTVGGTISIEGVPIKLRARSDNGFTAYAELGGAQTLPVKQLMKTYIPAVPPPSDLTIDVMSVIVAPERYYSFSMTVAQQPQPWLIPLGPKTLSISDVSLLLNYPSGGPISGSFGGTIALDSIASLSMAYDIPGPLVIKANLPRINLKDLAREIAGVLELPMPSGFPELELDNSLVSFTRESSEAGATYDFLLRTTVAIGSVKDFNLGALLMKTPQKTGFAVGIWTPKWADGAGWSPGKLWQPLSVLEIDSAGLVVSTIAPPDTQRAMLLPIQDVPALAQSKFKLVAGVNFFADLKLHAGGVAVLKQIFGEQTAFSLFAAFDPNTQSATLVAHLGIDFSKAAFTFKGFDLVWDSVGTSVATISMIASGSLAIEGNNLLYGRRPGLDRRHRAHRPRRARLGASVRLPAADREGFRHCGGDGRRGGHHAAGHLRFHHQGEEELSVRDRRRDRRFRGAVGTRLRAAQRHAQPDAASRRGAGRHHHDRHLRSAARHRGGAVDRRDQAARPVPADPGPALLGRDGRPGGNRRLGVSPGLRVPRRHRAVRQAGAALRRSAGGAEAFCRQRGIPRSDRARQRADALPAHDDRDRIQSGIWP